MEEYRGTFFGLSLSPKYYKGSGRMSKMTMTMDVDATLAQHRDVDVSKSIIERPISSSLTRQDRTG